MQLPLTLQRPLLLCSRYLLLPCEWDFGARTRNRLDEQAGNLPSNDPLVVNFRRLQTTKMSVGSFYIISLRMWKSSQSKVDLLVATIRALLVPGKAQAERTDSGPRPGDNKDETALW